MRGVAFGAGWNLALGCDLVVATPDATFSQVFARRGLSLDCGGSWLLPKLVGVQQAKRLALLAETVDAATALELGLLTWIVDDAEIDEFVGRTARRLAAAPPIAVARTKTLLNEGADRTMREALTSESRAQAVNFATRISRRRTRRSPRNRRRPSPAGGTRHGDPAAPARPEIHHLAWLCHRLLFTQPRSALPRLPGEGRGPAGLPQPTGELHLEP